MFQIIPVLDLMKGRVVHAAGGDRKRYAPWISNLCPNACPYEAVDGLLALFPFPVIYAADLDGIEGGGRQTALMADLVKRFPAVEFWTDNGITGPAAVAEWKAQGAGPLVLGSESLSGTPRELSGVILSLDFKGGSFLGPPELLENAGLWPEDVIIMTIDQVGRGAGPDFARLKALKEMSMRSRLYAAGGVRHAEDLASLRNLGISGALIATALHNGGLDASTIAGFMDGAQC
jgi:HisA/HisF family protein